MQVKPDNYGISSQRTHQNSSSKSNFGRVHYMEGFEMMGEDLTVMKDAVTSHAKGPERRPGSRDSQAQLNDVPSHGIAVTTDIEQRVE